MHQLRIGTSGWNYPSWRGDFYPAKLSAGKQLSFLGQALNTVEINGSFYSLKSPRIFGGWRDQVPDDFVFAVKGSRFITHMKRLNDIESALANFFASGPTVLEHKLGPMLWQLPDSMHFDSDLVADFFRLLPRDTRQAEQLAGQCDRKIIKSPDLSGIKKIKIRHAVEARHESFDSGDFYKLADRSGIAVVCSDSAGKWPQLRHWQHGWAYLRLHGPRRLYAGSYQDHDDLSQWQQLISDLSEDRDVYVYFDNDADGYAPHDALALRQALSAKF